MESDHVSRDQLLKSIAFVQSGGNVQRAIAIYRKLNKPPYPWEFEVPPEAPKADAPAPPAAKPQRKAGRGKKEKVVYLNEVEQREQRRS